MPKKTVSEQDVKPPPVLWHEDNGRRPRDQDRFANTYRDQNRRNGPGHALPPQLGESAQRLVVNSLQLRNNSRGEGIRNTQHLASNAGGILDIPSPYQNIRPPSRTSYPRQNDHLGYENGFSSHVPRDSYGGGYGQNPVQQYTAPPPSSYGGVHNGSWNTVQGHAASAYALNGERFNRNHPSGQSYSTSQQQLRVSPPVNGYYDSHAIYPPIRHGQRGFEQQYAASHNSQQYVASRNSLPYESLSSLPAQGTNRMHDRQQHSSSNYVVSNAYAALDGRRVAGPQERDSNRRHSGPGRHY